MHCTPVLFLALKKLSILNIDSAYIQIFNTQGLYLQSLGYGLDSRSVHFFSTIPPLPLQVYL